ncbi:MAG: FAD-binding oxidoreductase [Calothrix sp. SM1_5_4]|nr:FAD-binding oxidoreductase [Calothrix sp. SM1_5_4]
MTQVQMRELNGILEPARVLTGEADLKEYGRDWTKYFEPKPAAVVFPKNTEEVVALVKWARAHRVGLVPSGGRTGLSGGACALNGEVVVSFQKMNRVLEYDPVDQTVTVEAGMVTEALQKFAEEKGLSYPVDFASRGSSQIGGNVATNAGGIKVLRFGLTRQWVAGLQAVTGTGEVLNLNNSLVKNATGYDLRHLLIGSEGTLALITNVTLNLTRPAAPPTVFIFGVQDLSSVMKIYHAYKAELPIMAFEMFTELALKHVVAHHKDLKRPLAGACPYYVLVELETTGDTVVERALEIFEQGVEQGWILDGIQAQNPQQIKELWRLREDISEATAPHTPYKNDISVRISKVPEFLQETDAILKREYPQFEVVWFGHIGDGNLHINILKPKDMSTNQFLQECKRVDAHIFSMIEKFRGSVSAEHGVGLTKKPYLRHTRSEAEIRLMQEIKKAFDPDGILNPGKVLDMNSNASAGVNVGVGTKG